MRTVGAFATVKQRWYRVYYALCSVAERQSPAKGDFSVYTARKHKLDASLLAIGFFDIYSWSAIARRD